MVCYKYAILTLIEFVAGFKLLFEDLCKLPPAGSNGGAPLGSFTSPRARYKNNYNYMHNGEKSTTEALRKLLVEFPLGCGGVCHKMPLLSL